MAETFNISSEPPVPVTGWLPAVALSWIIPGGGHFLLKQHYRGAILLGTITLTFVLGLMMRGAFFEPQTGDLLTTLIYCGGYFAIVQFQL